MSQHHETYHVRFYVLATILGIGIHLALEELTHPGAEHAVSWLHWTVFVAYVLTFINFFHGKVLVAEDHEFRQHLLSRPRLFLTELIFICAVFVSLALSGAFILEPRAFIFGNFLVRLFDLVLVWIAMTAHPDRRTRKAQQWWQTIDLHGVLLFAAVALAYEPLERQFPWVATGAMVLFTAFVVVDVAVDYSTNTRFFSPGLDGWTDLVAFWDAVQGEDGDIYRRRLIVPALRSVIDRRFPGGGVTLLDVGCGNGCVTRQLAELASVAVGVDKEEEMIVRAKRHLERRVERDRAVGRVETESAMRRPAGEIEFHVLDIVGSANATDLRFDVIVACFTLQDAGNLDAALRNISRLLSDQGMVVIVFENDAQFSYSADDLTPLPALARMRKKAMAFIRLVAAGEDGKRTEEAKGRRLTSRTWIEPCKDHCQGNGRRAVIVWGGGFAKNAQIDRPGRTLAAFDAASDVELATVTRHWSKENLVLEGRRYGLDEAGCWDLRFTPDEIARLRPDLPEYEMLLDYQLQPRFSLLVLMKTDTEVAGDTRSRLTITFLDTLDD